MRRFGPYAVSHLLDGPFEPSSDVLLHPAGEAARRAMIARAGPTLPMEVNCFLLHGPGGVALVDAGTGDHWGPGLGQARTALRNAGIAPAEVRTVLLTHVHGDHALGLLEGKALDGATPWLPEAEILVPAADLAFFTDPAARARLPPARHGGFDIAAALLRAYAGRLRPIPEGPVRGFPGIEAVPLPGHTPGHTGYRLDGAPHPLLLWGDLLHLSALQAADPEAGLSYDIDPALAARSRRALLARAAAEGWVVAGAHVPGFGRVEAEGAGYRIIPA